MWIRQRQSHARFRRVVRRSITVARYTTPRRIAPRKNGVHTSSSSAVRRRNWIHRRTARGKKRNRRHWPGYLREGSEGMGGIEESRPGGLSYRGHLLYRRARACPSPCVLLADCITSVGQDRLILTCSGAGAPELQRWARCLPVFACPPRQDKYRNGIMKHPHLIHRRARACPSPLLLGK